MGFRTTSDLETEGIRKYKKYLKNSLDYSFVFNLAPKIKISSILVKIY